MVSDRVGFGKAKPLPGQQGYNAKESDRLEADAGRMEQRLEELRLKMSEDKQKRDNQKLSGGNRWWSAREDRGSVRSYAKDVREKKPSSKSRVVLTNNQKKMNISLGKSGKPLRENRKDIQINTWSIKEVIEWLNSLSLSHHCPTFEFNEISGSVLIDLTPSDLDYLKIVDQAERKLILHSIESLKQKILKSASQKSLPPPCEIIDDKIRDVQHEQVESFKTTKTHWSHIKPLADHQVTNPNEHAPVNLADGDFDEENSHASFMKALLEWRSSDTEACESVQPENTTENEFWKNPLAGVPHEKNGGELLCGNFDEELSHKGFLEALQAWRHESKPKHSRDTAESSAGSPTESKRSCWQCYKICTSVVYDKVTSKDFCSSKCKDRFVEEYARFYKKV